jgi:LPXTG-motif cell wall-anchored protein
MEGNNDTYTCTIPGDSINSENILYHIEATDNATAPNKKYFGKDGEVMGEFKPEYDIEIMISSIPIIIDKKPMGNDVKVTSVVSVTFNEPMVKNSAEDAFSISPKVKGQFKWRDNKLIFTPDEYFSYNTTYVVTISKNAKDIDGNSITNDLKWSFTTIEGDGTPRVDKASDSNESNNSTLLMIGLLLCIIIILVVSFIILKRKKKTSTQVMDYQPQTMGAMQPSTIVSQTPPMTQPAQGQTTTTPYPTSYNRYNLPINDYQYSPTPYTDPSPQIPQPQSGYQQPSSIQVYRCEMCNASIFDPNRCPYCGWIRQF